MLNDLIQLINEEDKKNPLTDEALSKKLGIKRTKVTMLRQESSIGDSRERRKNILSDQIDDILESKANISERDLTKILKEKGFNISRYIVRDALSGKRLSKKFVNKTNNEMAFKHLIGHDGSLNEVVEQSKAAMLYPPSGLHTIITGPSGTGKSEMAYAMHQFAIKHKIIKKNGKLIIFNCADYANNSQLLLSQLFGHKKGSFTGANEDKSGLVEAADGGVLFLDEIHRLPSKGQEMLFYLLDKGIYRRLGDTEERKSKLTLIAATTEAIQSSLLLTFRRRIPMQLTLPALKDRPFSERYEIIKFFFRKESKRVEQSIHIERDVQMALMLYDCPGNIGQLKSDIQVICARAFLDMINLDNHYIKVQSRLLQDHIKKGLIKYSTLREKVQAYVVEDIMILKDEAKYDVSNAVSSLTDDGIYHFIEKRSALLESKDMQKEVIRFIVNKEIALKIKKQVHEDLRNYYKSNGIFDPKGKLFNVVTQMVELAQQRIQGNLQELIPALTIHLGTTIEWMQLGKKIVHPNLKQVKIDYQEMYDVASEMIEMFEESMTIDMPEDVVGFVALYLHQYCLEKSDIDKSHVGILAISHGGVALEMVKVANELLGTNHAHGLSMPLDVPFENVLEIACQMVVNIDEGKGVLLLVDMGSLTTLDRLITERTGIKTKILSKVSTIQLLEAVRRAILPDSELVELYAHLRSEMSYIEHMDTNKKPSVIITTCITGKGSAIKIKELLKAKLAISEDIKIISCGNIGKSIKEEVRELTKRFNVVAVVGTLDPQMIEIPFISLESALKPSGTRMIEVMINERNGFKKRGHDFKEGFDFEKDFKLIKGSFDQVEEILKVINENFEIMGSVKSGFYESMLAREKMVPTSMDIGLALPHGELNLVKRPSLIMVVLNEPINWSGLEVQIVTGLALNEKSIYLVEAINNLFNSKLRVKKLSKILPERLIDIFKEEVEYYAQ